MTDETKVASDTGAGLDHLTRAKARADRRAASGEVSVEGSIYEGMEACLVQHGRTIAHVPRYSDAVDLAARLAIPKVASEGTELREAVQAARDFIMSENHETGCCMCGSPVEGHGYGDGHSPVDEGSYHAAHIAEELDAVLATDATDGATSEEVDAAPGQEDGIAVQKSQPYGNGGDLLEQAGCHSSGMLLSGKSDLLEQAARVADRHAKMGEPIMEPAAYRKASEAIAAEIRALSARNQTDGGEK